MSSITDGEMLEALDVLDAQQNLDKHIKDILISYLGLENEENKKNPGYMAYAGMALAVGMSFANLLLVLKKPESNRGTRIIHDLTYILNSNEFWQRNSSFLMPLVIATLNAQTDYVLIASERKNSEQYPLYDRVLRGTEMMGLELFTMLLYLVGGPELMAKSSMLRLELAPLLFR